MKPVTWGVLGTSRYARDWIVKGMMKSPDIRVVAVGSRTPEKGAAFAQALGIPRVHASYEALLADPEIEAIYNPLPNHLHVPLTLAAARAGKHSLCEKPIALNADEAAQLRAIPAGILVAEAFMVRHHPQWHEALAIIQSGKLGPVHTLQSFFSFYLDDPADTRHNPAWGGGGLLDIGVYPVVTARYIFGAEPVRVVALIENDPRFKVDRLASAILDFGGGRRAVFTTGTQTVAHQRLEIFGSKGRVELAIPFNPPLGGSTRVIVDHGATLGGGSAVTSETAAVDQYQLEAEAFGRAIRGLEPLRYGVEDAIANMKVIDALFRSARSNSWEKI